MQDDTETKDLAIDNMDAVFRQAILTIIAADAEDADEGIAGGCSRPRERIQRVYRYDDNLRLNVTEMCDTGNPIIATISSPWSRRAWTFQERHFSKRILLFLNSSVYWSCGCLRWAEDRCSLSERNAPPWDYYDQPIFETDSFALYLNSPGIIGQEALLFAWQNLLETYSGLDLTFQSDILRALAGLQTYFSHFFKTEFLFGNPIEGFANYLWWFPSGPTRAMRRLTDGVIPTWSWAGSVCETQFYRFEIPDRKESTRERFVLTMPPNGQDEGEDPDILSAKALKLHTMSRMLRLEERTQRSPFAGLPYQYCFNYDLVTSEGVVLGIVSSMSERIYNRYYEPAATTTATEEPANSSDANVETDDNASNAEIEKEDTELESESSSPESKADTASEVKNDADAPLGGWGPREFIVVSNELMDGGGKGLVLRHPFYWVLMVERKGDIVHRVGIGRVEADIWHKGEEEGEDGFAWKDVLLI